MEHLDIDFAILKSEKVSKEVKINLILEMLHLKQITLKKANELCMESGIYTKHWKEVDEEMVRVHNDFYNKLKQM